MRLMTSTATKRRPGRTGFTLPALAAAAILLAITACERPGDVPADPTGPDASLATARERTDRRHVGSDLAPLRAMAARFRRFAASQEAGYTVQATGCRANPPVGAMGIHYLNPAHLDGSVSALTPEIVIYEPGRNGRLRFVGLEYIIPYTFVPETADPPELFGQQFLQNPGDQLWMLHVWIGRNNPDGLFATWNPKVSCEYAS